MPVYFFHYKAELYYNYKRKYCNTLKLFTLTSLNTSVKDLMITGPSILTWDCGLVLFF